MGKKSKDDRLNGVLKFSFIIFLISACITLFIILNKGVVFGNRLIDISDMVVAEEVHVIQVVTPNTYLKNVGDSTELKISIDGADTLDGFTLSSSDEDVIKIEGTNAIATGLGTAVITAKSEKYGVENTVTLDVIVPITKLDLSAEFSKITIGEKDQISYSTTPKDSNVTVDLIYESSDSEIATVDASGVVTGVSAGTVTITATDRITGISDTYKITVK